MKVYNRFLTGIAALALVFSGLSGCETPTGDPGPRGADIPHYLSIESATTVVAPGGPDSANVFHAIFKGGDVSSNLLTKWEVSGDGAYTTFAGPSIPIDGHHPGTTIRPNPDLVVGGYILNVDKDEQAATLQITASHGGYSASFPLKLGARGLSYIRLEPGSSDGYTKIVLYDGQSVGGNEATVLTQPKFGYYFVYTKTETEEKNVLKDQKLETMKTVNEAEEILVKNGDWITVYEVPQDELYNTSINGYVSLQVHSSASEIYAGIPLPNPLNEVNNLNPQNVLVPNLYEPPEYHVASATSPNSVLEIADPGVGTTSVVTQNLPAYPVVYQDKYNAWAFDQATYAAMNKDAPLVTTGGVVIEGTSVTLPTVGTWTLVVQHRDSGAWWDIDTADVRHSQYSSPWEKQPAENILTVTISGGKKLTRYNGIAVNGIPFSNTALLSTWSKDPISGNTSVRLFLGDLDLTAPAAQPTTPDQQFVAGTGTGVMVSIPADHFADGTAPVTTRDTDVQIRWETDADIRGRIVTSGVKLDDDDRSVVRVVNPYTGASITEHYNFQWYFVEGTTWTPVTQKTSVEDPFGQWVNTYQPEGTEAGKYLGLKVTGQSGYIVHGDKEFVFGVFTD
jgi:hypothetical protein